MINIKTAIINKIIPFSCVDGIGNRTAIFFEGCNFNCLYCHNPETISICIGCGDCCQICPVGAIKADNNTILWDSKICIGCDECIRVCKHNSSPKTVEMTTDELLDVIKNNQPFINGITVSGGECTIYHEFLGELFSKVKELGLTTFVDSNGFIDFSEMPTLLNSMDKAMIDIKAFDENEHIMLTGKTNGEIIKNIKLLAGLDKLYEIRTVVVPEILNNALTVEMASKLIAPYKNIRYKLIKYRQLGVRSELIKSASPTDAMMNELKEIALNNGVSDVVIV